MNNWKARNDSNGIVYRIWLLFKCFFFVYVRVWFNRWIPWIHWFSKCISLILAYNDWKMVARIVWLYVHVDCQYHDTHEVIPSTSNHNLIQFNPSWISVQIHTEHRKCNTCLHRFLFYSSSSSASPQINADSFQIRWGIFILSPPIKFNGLILKSTLSDIIMIHTDICTPLSIFFKVFRFESLLAFFPIYSFLLSILSTNCYPIYFSFFSPFYLSLYVHVNAAIFLSSSSIYISFVVAQVHKRLPTQNIQSFYRTLKNKRTE